MARTIGIDLGTTNSEVAVVDDGQSRVLPGADGDLLLPSCVGLDEAGNLVIGREALRQYAAAPERTVRSIKRWMGTDHTTTLGDRDYRPEEISALILKALKQRAETALGEPVSQAVITVPAYFTDAQRQATKTAGELAGLEVLQIINEPTAAALAYDIRSEETERLLVYDLGGGTFDVSIVEVTGEVTEVLASHGNNRLGGDDFDRRLQLHLGDRFRQVHNTELPSDPLVQARLLRAAEEVKRSLSDHAFVSVREAYLVTQGKTALHLETEVARTDFDDLIRPLLRETLEAIDRAFDDAKLTAEDIDRVVLVGGSTRIPLVRTMITEHLGQAPVDGVQPDLCVALGAALQAGVLSGESVDSILVDVTPHSLGIAAMMMTPMGPMPGLMSTIIPRNTVVPVSKSELYETSVDNQEKVLIEIFQGENAIAEENVPLGQFFVENLPPRPAGDLTLEVHFDFDVNGILTVTATEKGKGAQQSFVVSQTEGVQRLSSRDLKQSQQTLDSLFSTLSQALETGVLGDEGEEEEGDDTGDDEAATPILPAALAALIDRAEALGDRLSEDQAEELEDLLERIVAAAADETGEETLTALQSELEDFLYYVNPD